MAYCAYCGGAVQEGEDIRFCPHCGKAVASSSPKGLETELVELLKAGKAIEAIKRHRGATGAGLKEAKDAVDALAAKNGLVAIGGSPGKGMWILRLLGSAFAGLMVATAGVAVFPDIGVISKPFLCDGLAVVSQHYSYKPGQSGVTRTFYCGSDVVTWKVMFFTFLIYTAIFFGVWTVLKFVRRLTS